MVGICVCKAEFYDNKRLNCSCFLVNCRYDKLLLLEIMVCKVIFVSGYCGNEVYYVLNFVLV